MSVYVKYVSVCQRMSVYQRISASVCQCVSVIVVVFVVVFVVVCVVMCVVVCVYVVVCVFVFLSIDTQTKNTQYTITDIKHNTHLQNHKQKQKHTYTQ